MQILVILNQILDPAGMTVNRRAQRVFVNRQEYVMNPADACALEAALQLCDASDGKVTVLALGPDRVDDTLRQALSMGAQRGVHLADERFRVDDPAVRARVLARAAKLLEPFDLIVAGDQVTDSDAAQLGPRVAEILELPYLHSVEQLVVEKGKLTAAQAAGTGYVGLESPLPAVASVPAESYSPRYGTAAQIMNVYRNPAAVERWGLAELGLEPEELAPVTRKGGRSFPEERELGDLQTGTANELAARLGAVLAALHEQS